MSEAPTNFDEDEAGAWNLWVLDHDLPKPPEILNKGESVPVARWAGPAFGAVLRVEWSWSSEPSEADDLVSVVQILRRTSRGWDETSDDGGGGWFDPPLKRPNMGKRDVHVGGLHVSGRLDSSGAAVWGCVGPEVTTLDLIAHDRVTYRPVDSSVGAIVMAFDATVTSVIHMSASDGALIKSLTYDPETFLLE